MILGLDIGSVSVKFALLEGDALVAKLYLRNTGLIDVIQRGLSQLKLSHIEGVGVTGSGQEFVKSLIGADYADTEIISHMVATLQEYPKARTIMDIGGEDSKLCIIKHGVLSDFQMNRACAGGTGSMIEAIASRLGVKTEDIGELALRSKDPAIIAGKCGVFAQSSAVSELSKGRPVEDILMGICRALVGNYLATLAKGKKLLEPIVFQGATALNKALVRCFEETLGKPVLVPRNCAFMGAIGIALLTEESMNGRRTNFRGKAILGSQYRTEVWHCHDCENSCELLNLYCDGELLTTSGSSCGKNNC